MNRKKPTPTRAEIAETMRLGAAKAGVQKAKIYSSTGLVALSMIFIGFWVLSGRQIVISDEMKILAVTTIGFGVVSAPYMITFVKKIWNPPQVFVVRVNITKQHLVRVFTGSPELWDEVDVVTGESYNFAVGNKMVYIVTNFVHVDDLDPGSEFANHVPDDAAGYVASGSWLGEAADAEIVHARHRIEKNRRRNDIRARVGDKILATMETVGRNSELRHHQSLTEHSIRSNLFDGDGMLDEIKNEIPELRELNEGKSVVEIVEDEVDRQMQELNTDNPGAGDRE
ncbi:hypothetical protein ACFQH6_15135 [Halobacteriaceae archaeon GCM10025711]